MQAATGSGSALIGQQPEGSTVASFGDLFLGTVMLRGQDCFSVPCVCRQVFQWGALIIIIKVFIKRKILSVEAILSAYTHTNTHSNRHPHTRAY